MGPTRPDALENGDDTNLDSIDGDDDEPTPVVVVGGVDVDEERAGFPSKARLGFTATPFSEQFHRLQSDGPLVPAGTGNRCVMLREGYLEFLTPFMDTPVAGQLRDAIARYTGVHLIAYGTADAEADHARLSAAGFAPLPPVRLQREADVLRDVPPHPNITSDRAHYGVRGESGGAAAGGGTGAGGTPAKAAAQAACTTR
jgi:hypothetical protein